MKCCALHACILAVSSVLLPGLVQAGHEEQSECAETPPGMTQLAQHPSLYIFYLENDLFNGTDKDYTSGVKFSWVSTNLQDYISDPCLPRWLRQLNQFFETLHFKKTTSRNMVVTAGQAMFTPSDRQRPDLIRTDRPYAGWLYLGLGYNARNAQRMESAEVNMGIVGPAAAAKQTQDFIHDLRGRPLFNGWDNQLKNEPGIQIVAERKRKVLASNSATEPQFDAITHYGLSVGNIKTYLNAGAELRVGNRIPDDFGTAPIRPTGDSNAPHGVKRTSRFSEGGMHAFVSADARIVARDIFLDGNTFARSHHVEKKILVGDIAAGIAWQWPGGKITYAHYIRSKEFVGQRAAQGYGSITVSIEH